MFKLLYSKLVRFSALGFLAIFALFLVGCSGKANDGDKFSPAAAGSANGTAGAPAMTVSLLDSTGQPTQSITQGSASTVRVTVRNMNGTGVANAVVQFKTDSLLALFTPSTATAITDSSGNASISISPRTADTTGSGSITATSQIGNNLISGSVNYSIALPTITLSIRNADGLTTNISNTSPTSVSAIVKNGAGTPMPNTVVTFTSNASLTTLKPESGTALTDGQGVATVAISPTTLTAAGADTLTATAKVDGRTTTSSITYSVGNATITLSDIYFGAQLSTNTLAAFGTTPVGVGVYNNGKLVTTTHTVTFTSACATDGTDKNKKASLTASAQTVNGIATATYTDQGCGKDDIITASVNGIATTSRVLSVQAATQPTIALSMSNSSGNTANISSSSPAKVTAVVKNSTGAAVEGAVVTFKTDEKLATLTPSSATALTDASGTASVMVTPLNLTSSGAASIIASTQVDNKDVTKSLGYSIGAANVSMSALRFGTSTLAAYATTEISVSISSNGSLVTTPQTVTFSSPCASSGKAALTESTTTINGVATATYRDKGCLGSDFITATLSGITSSSGTLAMQPPGAGSIQFVSATPTSISLKGMGGSGRQEYSQVTFKVVDTSGNPVGGKTVDFSLSTKLGGINITPSSAITDPTTGQVVVIVNAGTESTPVRVLATTTAGSTTLTTQSDQLTITTGIPEQQNISISSQKHNIEGWNYDGITTVVTAHLSDHFNNPVQDGTTVNFRSEGGMIEPSCVTKNGACSVTFTSAASRPSNGRATVLAYAIGGEGFTDLNGNGLVDPATEMIDANGRTTDMGEAFIDYNENGVRDEASEPYIDFNGDGKYNEKGDGKYNGVLCDASVAVNSTATACSAAKSIHVRDSMPIIFSGSTPSIKFTKYNATTGTYVTLDSITLPPCTTAGNGATYDITVTIIDSNGNQIPMGSTIELTATNGKVRTESLYTVPDTQTCRTGAGCPIAMQQNTLGDYLVTLQTDAVYDATATPACKNTTNSGTLNIKVKTPNGKETVSSITVND